MKQQLNIQDAGFIYQETTKTPMHISGLAIFDQSTSQQKRMTKSEIINYIGARIHQAPILKQKLKQVPLELERPYWSADNNFDLANHIFQLALPKPGNKQQLIEVVSKLTTPPLNMKRPLWEVYIIEGLDDYPGAGPGSFAMLTKIHHSCIDGGSGNNLFAALVDLDNNPATAVASDHTVKTPVEWPNPFQMLTSAYTRNAISAMEQTVSVIKRFPRLARTASALYRGQQDSGARLSVPKTRFNRTPDEDRTFGFTTFNLKDIKAIKNAVPGTTVNDVMVCIVAGGMRYFLAHHNELPEQSLGAMMPKNLRQGEEHAAKSGNRVGGLFSLIHTNIAHPKERLTAINESTQKAKAFSHDIDSDTIFPHLMGGFLYPKVGRAFARFSQKHRLMERMGPVVLNTVITNVVGPGFDLYHAGAKQVSFCGIPPLTDGVSISHAICSMQETVGLGVVSCPAMLGDGQFYMDCCEKSFQELMAETVGTK